MEREKLLGVEEVAWKKILSVSLQSRQRIVLRVVLSINLEQRRRNYCCTSIWAAISAAPDAK